MKNAEQREAGPPRAELARVMEQNIDALQERRAREAREKSLQERVAEKLTLFAGSMTFVYLHIAFFAVWIAANLGWLGIEPFDETFATLAMVASVEAIFLSTFVLITQNRMSAEAEKRSELNLQVSLLAEHEITKIVQMVQGMSRQMGVPEAEHPDLEELKQDVVPEKVLDKVEEKAQEMGLG